MLDDRKLTILRAIVTEYVSMREPVGSRALVERYQLDVSLATVATTWPCWRRRATSCSPHQRGSDPDRQGLPAVRRPARAVKPLPTAERRAIEISWPAR